MPSSSANRSSADPIPLRSPEPAIAVPVSLPRSLTSFVGRERELTAIRDLLLREAVRLVTLTGPGGVGKTRLSIRVAEDVSAEFPQGVWFVPLAPVGDVGFVLQAIAQALELELTGDESVEDQIVSFFGTRPALLLMDNLEHLLDCGSVVAGLLHACPNLKILATSRAVLRLSGEHAYAVPPLDLPSAVIPANSEAVRLFVDRAIAADAHFALTPDNVATIDAICLRLDGLPLAIELAASRIAILSPAALLARLDQRLTILTHGPRDAPPRLRTMRDAIAWSYDLLDPDEQPLFRRLAIFVGSFTLEAAEHVSRESGVGSRKLEDRLPLASDSRLPTPDSPASNVLDAITSLVEQSLVRRVEAPAGEIRFGMLETIREFGLEQLALAGEMDEVRGSHAAYFVDLAERGGQALRASSETQAPWWHRLNADIGNFRATLTWLRDTGRIADALRLAGGLDWFWSDYTYTVEGLRWLDGLLASAEDTIEPAVRAKAMGVASMLAYNLGETARSQELNEAALPLWRAAGNDEETALALNSIASSLYVEGNLAEAEVLALEALALARRCDAPWTIAIIVHMLGRLTLARGKTDEALVLLRDAITGYRETDDPLRVLSTRCDEGLALLLSGDDPTAYDVYLDVLETDLEIDEDRGIVPQACLGLATLAADANPSLAARLLGAAFAHIDRVGWRPAPVTLAAYDALIAPGRARFGESAWNEALAAGRSLPIEAAADEARTVPRPDVEAPESPLPAVVRDLGLTKRETEVLALLAERLSDREIADRLFISPRTASKHVQAVLAKLGFDSRRVAAAEAKRLGLG